MSAFKQFFIPAVRFRAFSVEVANLDGQGLRMDWEVTRDNTSTPDEGVVRLYNLAPSVSGFIHEQWEARAPLLAFKSEIEIGWDGVPQRLMIGDTWDLVPQERTPTDIVTVVKFGDGAQAIRDEVVKRDYKGVRIDIAIEVLVVATSELGGLNLTYPKASRALVTNAVNATAVPVLRNLSKGRNTRQVIDDLMDTIGLEWRVQNGAFIAMRGGIISRPGPILRPNKGLLNFQKRNDGGILADALANPDVEPGIQIQVQGNDGKPFGALAYRVEKVVFTGNTRAESLMRIEAAKAVSI